MVDVNKELKFCENSKEKKNLGGGGGGVRRRGRVGGWGGVRVDVIEELKFLGKFTKKWGVGGVRSGGGGGVGLVGGGQGGCE